MKYINPNSTDITIAGPVVGMINNSVVDTMYSEHVATSFINTPVADYFNRVGSVLTLEVLYTHNTHHMLAQYTFKSLSAERYATFRMTLPFNSYTAGVVTEKNRVAGKLFVTFSIIY